MKALILKDFYNLKTIVKSYVLIFVFFAICFLPKSGSGMFMPMVVVYCSMMTISSFSFDEHCKWDRFGLVMPLTRRQVVGAKFVFMLLISLTGVLAAAIVSLLAALLLEMGDVADVIALAPVSLALGMVLMGTMIPLIFRFGPERGRLLLLLSMVVPFGVTGVVWLLDAVLGIELSEQMVMLLLWTSPLAAGVWDWVMYCVACCIYEKKEF